jgi:hypothetical protein
VSGFLITVKRPYVQLRVKEDSINPEALITGQTEGLKGGFRNGWMGGWVGLRNWWVGGFAKVDNRFGYQKWLQGGSAVLALL